MTQALPCPILPQCQIGSYMGLNGENFYKVINWKKLAVNDQFDRKLMFLTKNVPRGLSAPAPGLYTYIWPLTIISNISSESTMFELTWAFRHKVVKCNQLNESFMSTKGQSQSLTLVQITYIQYF